MSLSEQDIPVHKNTDNYECLLKLILLRIRFWNGATGRSRNNDIFTCKNKNQGSIDTSI